MRFVVLVAMLAFMCGCNGTVPPIKNSAPVLSPISAKGKETKIIFVTKVVGAIGEGVVVGKAYGGKLCVFGKDIVWHNDDKTIEVSSIVTKKLEANGYNTLGQSGSPFPEQLQAQADYLLGGRMVKMEANTCSSIDGVKGQAFLKIAWDLFDTKTKKVVATIESEGHSDITEFIPYNFYVLYAPAINMATDNLMADKRFFELLVKSK